MVQDPTDSCENIKSDSKEYLLNLYYIVIKNEQNVYQQSNVYIKTNKCLSLFFLKG